MLCIGSARTIEQPQEGAQSNKAGHEGTSVHRLTSSACSRIDSGILSPSALAVLRLTTSSNFVGCWMGRSLGFGALQNLIDVPRCAPVHVGEIGRVAQEGAVDAPLSGTSNDWKSGLSGMPKDRRSLRCEKGAVQEEEGLNVSLSQRRERAFNITWLTGGYRSLRLP